MSVPETVRKYLEQSGLPYQLVEHPANCVLEQLPAVAHVPDAALLKAVLLRCGDGLLLAVLPVDRLLDLACLRDAYDRRVVAAQAADVKQVFADCAVPLLPPLGAAYNIPTVVDASVLRLDTWYFASGGDRVVQMRGVAFDQLEPDTRVLEFAVQVAARPAAPEAKIVRATARTPAQLQERLDQLEGLPAMPNMAHRLLTVCGDEEAGAAELAEVIELDPSLAAQIVSYSRSALYGYRGTIMSVRDAITRVLGFDLVANIALGLSLGQVFNVPTEGPLGQRQFWRHAVYTASLVERIAASMPPERRLPGGLGYLAGLLHDFGHLITGHMFAPEFQILNDYAAANPRSPVQHIERLVLGITHVDVGAQVLEAWNLPAQVIQAVRWHHREEPPVEHGTCARLVYIADRLLSLAGRSHVTERDLPPALLRSVGITVEEAMELMALVLEQCEELDVFARELAA